MTDDKSKETEPSAQDLHAVTDGKNTVQFSVVFDDEETDMVPPLAAPSANLATGENVSRDVSEDISSDVSENISEDSGRTAGDADGETSATATTAADSSKTTVKTTGGAAGRATDSATGDETAGTAEPAAGPQTEADPTHQIISHIDHELESRHEDDILLKSYPTFALDHVSLRNHHSGRLVLDDVELSFYARNLYAVVVEDDEQRRALLEVLSGFRHPDKGQVMLKSVDLATLTTSEIRGHRIGLVPQRFALRPDLDATANIVYAMDAAERTFLKPKPVLARELLTRVGFDGAATGEPVREFNALQQRRIAIARAISCEATAIVIDEPSSDLDADERKTILSLLTTLAHTGETARCIVMLTTSDTDIDAADRYFEL